MAIAAEAAGRLGGDVVALGIEAGAPRQLHAGEFVPLAPGLVDSLIERDAVGALVRGASHPGLFPDQAELLSTAIFRLRIGPRTPPAVYAVASADPTRFDDEKRNPRDRLFRARARAYHRGMARPVEDLIQAWLASLAHERRASPHTLRAYGDDVRRFLSFIGDHRGGHTTLASLARLTPAELRAFLTLRRAQGLGPRGLQRALAGIRSLYRYLEREGLADGAAARAVRSPRPAAHVCPGPLSETDAARTIAEAGERHTSDTHPPWLDARNVALITLLYGTGLRISEALSLKRGDAPLGESLTVIGKGRKERSVPVLAVVRRSDRRLRRHLPDRGREECAHVRVAPRQSDERARGAIADCRICVRGWACRRAQHRMRFGIPMPRIFLRGGGDLRAVQELLGHVSLSTTQKIHRGRRIARAGGLRSGAPARETRLDACPTLDRLAAAAEMIEPARGPCSPPKVHQHVGRIELPVDHRAVADIGTRAYVSLDQRRQRFQRGAHVDGVLGHAVHFDIELGRARGRAPSGAR